MYTVVCVCVCVCVCTEGPHSWAGGEGGDSRGAEEVAGGWLGPGHKTETGVAWDGYYSTCDSCPIRECMAPPWNTHSGAVGPSSQEAECEGHTAAVCYPHSHYWTREEQVLKPIACNGTCTCSMVRLYNKRHTVCMHKYICMYMYMYIHVFKWEMRRKKERSKQGQTNKQGKATQHTQGSHFS